MRLKPEDRPTAGDSNCTLELLRIPGPTYQHSLVFAQLAAEAMSIYAGAAPGHPDQDSPNVRIGTYDVPSAYRDAVRKVFNWYFPELADHNQFTDVSLVVFRNVPMHQDRTHDDEYFLNVLIHSEGAIDIRCLNEHMCFDASTSLLGPYQIEPVEGDSFILDPRSLHSVIQLEIPDGISIMLQYNIDRERFNIIQR